MIPIIAVLRKIGHQKCLEKATLLEQESAPINSLNLRNLDLNAANISSIASVLKEAGDLSSSFLKSISFSYNLLLGDEGAIALASSLPNSISEIGLVGCGINDAGGVAILNWMREASNLKMICIEQNHFSAKIRLEFKKFSSDHPQIFVVF